MASQVLIFLEISTPRPLEVLCTSAAYRRKTGDKPQECEDEHKCDNQPTEDQEVENKATDI